MPQPYPHYRDSGIEWLGGIPEGWNIGKFRHVFRESSEMNGPTPVGEMLSVSGYRGVELKVYDDENRKRSDADLETYRVVRPGQLAVNTMWLNYAGLGVSELTGHMSPAYRAYEIVGEVHARFIHHLMRCSLYVTAYTGELAGIRPNSLQMSRSTLMEWPVVLPTLDEQRQIADYLDTHTAKIDTLIGKQEQLIETLAERRQAVISHAVTKGLDPNVPMRDSGILWLGQVPRAWSVKRLSWLFSVIGSGTTPPRDDMDYYGPGTPWVTTGELRENTILATVDTVTSKALATFPTLRVYEPGTLLIAMYGATRGRLGVLGVAACTNQACCALASPGEVNTRYVHYALLASRKYLLVMAVGGSQQMNINQDTIRSLRLATPSLAEQMAIVEYLDKETAQMDALSAKARQMIDVLKERRQALISAAVTGKIDVRGLA